MKAVEEKYSEEYIDISFRVIKGGSEECLLETFEKNEDICFLDLIQNTDEFGRGEGSRVLQNFFKYLVRHRGISKVYSFATYDEFYYEDEEGESNLSRLIRFYEKNGFNILAKWSNNADQVDMSLELNKYGVPTNIVRKKISLAQSIMGLFDKYIVAAYIRKRSCRQR